MRVLGINAVFHDPAAAIVVDGRIVAAAEEERFSRRKHGKQAVPFSTWELPEQAIRWCLEAAGLTAADLDAVAYSYDPSRAPATADVIEQEWEGLRTLYAQRAPLFLKAVLPDLDPAIVTHVPHHHAHAASTWLASPHAADTAVLTADGRGESVSALLGHGRGPDLEVLAEQPLPDSLGLVYEELTAHLGFRRSSDEYKVMALAAYGEPRWLEDIRQVVAAKGDGGFVARSPDWASFAPPRRRGDPVLPAHADLASSVQLCLEQALVDLARWLADATGSRHLAMAGGVALNCVANSAVHRAGVFDDVWVQPASGDSGTALGAALWVAARGGDAIQPMTTAALGRGWSEEEIRAVLEEARVPHQRPASITEAAADVLAADGVVGWFEGRAEFGPRALGQRSLLADPRREETRDRLNAVKGREEFRPVAPVVLADRAAEIFTGGPIPSPYMLFTHEVVPDWAPRIPGALHVDGTARIQTVEQGTPFGDLLAAFDARTSTPVLINTSFNTAGRPIVDTPADALEVFASSPLDALVLGPFLVQRSRWP